jgi:hypothetical protein
MELDLEDEIWLEDWARIILDPDVPCDQWLKDFVADLSARREKADGPLQISLLEFLRLHYIKTLCYYSEEPFDR